MAARSNAISEITRFWLQARHKCLVYESLPVPVKYNQSDIDFLAVQAKLEQFALPNGKPVGPRVIVETKDEHDWEASGKEFGQSLDTDLGLMKDGKFVPRGTACRFTMLREEHFERAKEFFGSDEFDRLFVVHAMNPEVLTRHAQLLVDQRIHVLTIKDVVADTYKW